MVKHLSDVSLPNDPYSLLALTMLEEAFRTIKCYYSKNGSKDELIEGRRALRWIRKMEGTFKLVAIAANLPLDNFHQMCIWKINTIKEEVVNGKHKEEKL